MRMEGRIFRGKLLLHVAVTEEKDESLLFSRQLESCLLQYCKILDIAPPLWLEGNTRDFARFRGTVFFEEQFMEKVPFDRMQIRCLQDED